MIAGYIKVVGDAVETHRDSYLLHQLTVVSVRRPFFASGVLLGGGLLGFVLAFGDLLFIDEIVAIAVSAVIGLLVTWQAGQLKLISRDLRGTELSGVIWGRYTALNTKRHEIVRAIVDRRSSSDEGTRS